MYFTSPNTATSAGSAAKSAQFECTTGKQSYTAAEMGATDLPGGTLLQVSYDGKELQTPVSPADYTFDGTTGVLTFVITVNTGVPASILYIPA